ncbi:MAG: hypothetical protein RLZZ371_824 [Pseudomonadota bacterium]
MDKQTAKTHEAASNKRDYALGRMMIALDRVIASQTKEQRKKGVAWASLWYEHWKSLSPNAKQMRRSKKA